MEKVFSLLGFLAKHIMDQFYSLNGIISKRWTGNGPLRVPSFNTACTNWLAFLFLFGFVLFPQIWLVAQAPADTFRLALSLPVEGRFATTDNLGQLYLITAQNAIAKYAPDGKLLARYTNNRLGNATGIDATNPMKVLVWYADFRTVVFLNRSLTVLGELNLISAGFPEVRSIASAQDGNLWLYDEVDFQLRKISPAGEKLQESQALNLLMPARIQITCLRDDGDNVLAADPDNGLLQFDVYGQFQKMLPWKGITSFTVEQNQMSYLAGDSLRIEQLRAFASRTLALPAAAVQEQVQRWLAPRRLLVQKPAVLEIWTR